jgi:phenylacetic acid degradation protein paaN
VSQRLYDTHHEALEKAIDAIHARAYWSAYPEVPSGKVYGETARNDGLAAHQARLGRRFEIDQPGTVGWVGEEISPFGPALGITYPLADLDVLLPRSEHAMDDWKRADVETRAGACLEILHRLNRRSFEMALAVMHTTGQGFMMAFQAGGPHAQDRGLEAIAYAVEEMRRTPRRATWSKRVSKADTVTLAKTYRIVPRGVGVVIGCSTFPTWNGYPGLFASLVTGNAVVVKPHPGAIMPLALTVEIAREVLLEQGFDPNLVTLVADTADAPIAKELVQRPEIRIVDYTGSSGFGGWIEENARQAIVFTEKAGVNAVIIDSVDDLRATTGNLAFTVSLYSGQMCTTSQNIFIPSAGVETAEGHKSFDEIAGAIVKAVDWLLGDAQRGAEILGAIQNERTLARIEEARGAGGEVLRETAAVENATFPEARVRSPLIMKIDASRSDVYMQEWFGPIVYIVATDGTAHGLELATRSAKAQGAITWSVYSTSPGVLEQAEEAAAEAGVPLSCNLTGQIYVNQSAAFSDFHVTGANPAGNATLCDSAFIAGRFRIVQSRVLIPTPEPAAAAG